GLRPHLNTLCAVDAGRSRPWHPRAVAEALWCRHSLGRRQRDTGARWFWLRASAPGCASMRRGFCGLAPLLVAGDDPAASRHHGFLLLLCPPQHRLPLSESIVIPIELLSPFPICIRLLDFPPCLLSPFSTSPGYSVSLIGLSFFFLVRRISLPKPLWLQDSVLLTCCSPAHQEDPSKSWSFILCSQ
ncbi:unnamed protein product, partial [Urochloa humidicola]